MAIWSSTMPITIASFHFRWFLQWKPIIISTIAIILASVIIIDFIIVVVIIVIIIIVIIIIVIIIIVIIIIVIIIVIMLQVILYPCHGSRGNQWWQYLPSDRVSLSHFQQS